VLPDLTSTEIQSTCVDLKHTFFTCTNVNMSTENNAQKNEDCMLSEVSVIDPALRITTYNVSSVNVSPNGQNSDHLDWKKNVLTLRNCKLNGFQCVTSDELVREREDEIPTGRESADSGVGDEVKVSSFV